jgi:hypothetical protein
MLREDLRTVRGSASVSGPQRPKLHWIPALVLKHCG